MRVCIALTLCVGLFGCGGSSGDTFDRQAMLRDLGDNVILPTYRDFASRTSALNTSATAFCAAPDAASLTALQAEFGNAKEPLKEAEAFAYGPHIEQPWRLAPLVDRWPPDAPDVADVLAGDDELTDAFIEITGGDNKGLPAIEVLLFGGDLPGEGVAPRDNAAVLEAFGNERRCAYLTALTRNLAAKAQVYVDVWSPEGEDYIGELVDAGNREVFRSHFDAASTVVDQMIFTVENVRELKVGKPFGKRSSGRLQPAALEAPFSGRGIADALAAIRSSENIYRGSYGGNEGLGVRDWLMSRRPDLDAPIQQAYDDAEAALLAIDGPLREAITEDAANVEEAYQAIKTLQTILASELAGAVGVTVTFNPTDGD